MNLIAILNPANNSFIVAKNSPKEPDSCAINNPNLSVLLPNNFSVGM